MRGHRFINLLGGVSKGIRLSASAFPAGSAQGTAIGTLSVAGGTGTYTFTLTDSATNKAQVAGTNGVSLQAGSASASASTFNVTVHADNGAGSTFDKTFSITAWSSVSNSVAPVTTGSAVQGVTLSVSNGTWSGFPAPAYSFQWKRAGSAITGATASTYSLQAADVGSAITCTVTASNGFSSASATSSATASVTKTTLSYTPVTSATQGSAYTGATPATTNGTSPYVYSVSGSLPAGLSVNTSTGVISGTPTTVQTISGITLVVTDANGVTDSSASFSIAVASSSIPTAVTLTALPSTSGASAGVQRDIALTTGSPIFAGTYSGGTPTGIQGRVRKVSDNSVVTDWTTLTSATIGGGAFSGKMAGVPQGAGYYRDVRALNATSVTATDTTPFMIGIGLACYGQSNMGTFFSSATSPPSANAATAYFDGTNWVAVPAYDGVRTLLNTTQSVAGVPCFAINGAVTGTGIAALQKGDASGYYTAFIAKVLAMQGAEFLLWRHGESAATGAGMPEATYLAYLDQLHADVASDTGRTKAQIPGIASGLAWANETGPVYDTALWDLMQRTLIDAGTLTAFTYSHSNMDATLLADNLHEDGASCAKSATRYARSISTLLGVTSGLPKFAISASAVVDAVTSTVDITHVLGTDFTPATGNITGFEASGDGGTTWANCTAVHTSGTRITLTHTSLATNSNRKLRYQYGKSCDVSAPVLDNSSLAVPLLPSAGQLSPTPLTTLPVPTLLGTGAATSGGGTPASRTGVSLGTAAANRFLICALTQDSGTLPTSVVLTPNVGTAITLTAAAQTPAGANLACIYYGALLSDADTATTCTLTCTYASNPFGSAVLTLYSVDKTTLSSQTPVDGKASHATTVSTLSITNYSSSAGGFLIACGYNGASAGVTTHTLTGSETISSDTGVSVSSAYHLCGKASGVSAHTGDGTVTATFNTTDSIAIAVATWR